MSFSVSRLIIYVAGFSYNMNDTPIDMRQFKIIKSSWNEVASKFYSQNLSDCKVSAIFLTFSSK